ncbi:MAG: hypothetical protein JNK34_03750 [Tabrizicola sp.]|nr:hypothetical protein [Tabrizicola sp.]
MEVDHNQKIKNIARSVLRPAGISQRGKSRFWFDDRGWYATCIEFQPSGWSKGTYLNTAIMWFWKPKDYWSHDTNSERQPFVSAENERDFEIAVTSMSQIALNRSLENRRCLTNPAEACRMIERGVVMDWAEYHLGIASGLANKMDKAAFHLRRVINLTSDFAWVKERNEDIKELLVSAQDHQHFVGVIRDRVSVTREMLRLPKLSEPPF